MVVSTTRALAGTAASAARKVIGRRSRGTDQAPAAAPTAAASAEAPSPAVVKAVRATKAPATKRAAAARKTPAATKALARKTLPTPSSSKATTSVTTAKKTTASAPAATRKAATKAPAKAPAKSTARAGAKKGSATSPSDLLATLVVREGEDAWTAAELQEVVDGLHQARAHSVELLEEAEAGLDGLMRDSGDGAGQDQADMGATTFERDHELTVVNSERDKLAQIDRALGHIDDGTYGVCEACGEPIGKGRLMAFPRATLCMTCKQREERR